MDNTIKDRAIAWSEQHRDIYMCNADVIAEVSYKQGANEQNEAIRQALIERQGEYVSLELINEIFGDDMQYLADKILQATPKLKDGELEQILDSFNE